MSAPNAALTMLKQSAQYAGIGLNLHGQTQWTIAIRALQEEDRQRGTAAHLRNSAIPARPTANPVYEGCLRIAYGPLCTSLCPLRMPTSKVNNLPSSFWLHHRRPRPPHAIAAPATSCHVQGCRIGCVGVNASEYAR